MISYLYSTITNCRTAAERFGKPCLLFYDDLNCGYFYSTESPAYVAGVFPFAFLAGECNQKENKEESMPEIKCPTREQILSAAKEDCVVKKALEKLFPEAFEPELIPSQQLLNALSVRAVREYKEKGIYLNECYDWKIVTDSSNIHVLIATRKS